MGEDFLSWNDLQVIVSQVNVQIQEEIDWVFVVSFINEVLDKGSFEKILFVLLFFVVGLDDVSFFVVFWYYFFFVVVKRQKVQVIGDFGVVLWFEEICQGVVRVNQDINIVQRMVFGVVVIN